MSKDATDIASFYFPRQNMTKSCNCFCYDSFGNLTFYIIGGKEMYKKLGTIALTGALAFSLSACGETEVKEVSKTMLLNRLKRKIKRKKLKARFIKLEIR